MVPHLAGQLPDDLLVRHDQTELRTVLEDGHLLPGDPGGVVEYQVTLRSVVGLQQTWTKGALTAGKE